MFAKDPVVRITDTIAFIRTATVPTAEMGLRDPVADLLDDLYTRQRINPATSTSMSQGSNYTIIGRDAVKEVRAYRRAIILIKMALLDVHYTQAPFDANQITDANLPAALGALLAQIDQIRQHLTTKLKELRSQPLTFLGQHAFNMVGADQSMVLEYCFYEDLMTNVYNLAPEVNVTFGAAVRVRVFNIHVQDYGSLPAINAGQNLQVHGAIVNGAKFMVTTQLTGCSVVYYLNGASLVAAHVQPAGVSAEDMCDDLRDRAVLTSAPAQHVTGVFGAQNPKGNATNNYQKRGRYNYCIGIQKGGTWHLYAHERVPPNGGQQSWRIV